MGHLVSVGQGFRSSSAVLLLSSHVAEESVLAGGVRPQLLTTWSHSTGLLGCPRDARHGRCLLPGLPPASVDGPGAGRKRQCLYNTASQAAAALTIQCGEGGVILEAGTTPGATGSGMIWEDFPFSELTVPGSHQRPKKKDKVGRGGWTKES